mgnify:FL=1
MNNFLLEQNQKAERITQLTEFIQSNPDPREVKRALAVKMVLSGEAYSKISEFLGIHKSSITHWKQRFEIQGIDGITLGYKGSISYLTSEQKAEVISWLKSKDYWDLEELVTYLDEHYGVIYKSKQSYYNLFDESGISWKKSQKVNPKSDPELVKKKRIEIQNFIYENQAEIESEQLVVLFVDECHLLWGDVCGYVWGKEDIRVEIPIVNEKLRQTYFGALNYYNKEFVIREYSAGNGENTVNFMNFLSNHYYGKRIALIWDGASYHKSTEVKSLLATVNDSYQSSQWKFTCILFAPNSPEQNPVEDVWLQTKNFLRKFWYFCKSFPVVKWLFNFFTNHQQFDFPKLEQYAPCL